MEKKDKILIIISSCVLVILLLILFLMIINKKNKDIISNDINMSDKNNIVLDEYTQNVKIMKGGEYTLSGSFKYSVIVDTDENVTLNLNGVDINSNITSAIANGGKGDLVINILDNTVNNLSDSGFGEFDGCIYSKGKLIINGNGILNVKGNQEDGEGIATTNADIIINGGQISVESVDDGINIGGSNGGIITINNGNIYVDANGDGIDSNGSLVINGGNLYVIGTSKGLDSGVDVDKDFIINGGEVIVLGSYMLQNPRDFSNQKYISFEFDYKFDKDSRIVVKNDNEIIFDFISNDKFSTLILSNSNIKSGLYELYINDVRIKNYEIK